VVAVLALGVALLAILALAALVRTPSPVRVPSLSGKTYDAAAAELERAGLRPERVERSSAARVGQVVGQDPGAGTDLSRGGTVKLMVSRGDRRSVPDVRGQPLANALAILHSSGLASDIEGDSDEGGGVVVGQAPLPGIEVAAGSSVTLSVANPDEERDKARGKGKGRD
jgi:serine/threonine-protein kinase